jgi:NTE family protein
MMQRCMIVLATSLVLFAQGPTSVAAASDAEPDRPRVGLVLGGGGARGAAHIGVLKELERLRIPVDAIAGTSMGAIVGGLYATGMTAAELEQLVGSMDWAAALSDTPPRDGLSFRRKQDDAQYPMSFELGYRDGKLLLPQGAIQGQKLDLILRELTLGASQVTDFDDLPIPFRAVASDIGAGTPYVMAGGDLAIAIRASMSVPAAFAPVEIDGRLLVDGGLVGNLPVDVVREMDVDVVIAVDVEFPLYTAEELQSALKISEQILTILIRKDTIRTIEQLGDNDILIQPDLGEFASTNFAGVLETIQPGEEATRRQAAKLQALALQPEQYAAHVAARRQPAAFADELAFVRVVHDDRLSPRVLESRLTTKPGDRIDAARLAADAEQIYGVQWYEKVSYRLVQEDDAIGVEFDARTKSWGPNFLQFGLSLEEDFEGSTAFNLATRVTRAGINRLGAEWRTDLRLGTDPLIFSEFYQPLSFNSRFFVAPSIVWRQQNYQAFADSERVARYRVTDAEAGLDVGYEIGSVAEFRSGLFRGAGDARVKVGDPQLASYDFETGGVFAQLRVDSLDNANFPQRGWLANLKWTKSLESFGADNSFDTAEFDVQGAWSRGKSTLSLGLEYATTLDAVSDIQDYFPLGGFLRMSGFERGQIAGPHAAVARAVYYRRVGSSAGGLFELPIYVGASLEAGNVWLSRGDISFGSLLLNGSVFAGFDAPLGPVYLAAGFGEGGNRNVYLFIGSPTR